MISFEYFSVKSWFCANNVLCLLISGRIVFQWKTVKMIIQVCHEWYKIPVLAHYTEYIWLSYYVFDKIIYSTWFLQFWLENDRASSIINKFILQSDWRSFRIQKNIYVLFNTFIIVNSMWQFLILKSADLNEVDL